MKLRIVLAVIVLAMAVVALPSEAQTAYNPAIAPFVSCNGVAATGACSQVVFPPMNNQLPIYVSWQMSYTGTPTSITVNLEGSLDGTTWATVDTSTVTTGEIRFLSSKLVRFLRCNVSAYVVNGSTAKCQIIASR